MLLNTKKINFSRFIYIVLLIAISALAFWQITFFVHPVKFDMIDFHYPWRYFIGECLQNGKFPLWNPYQDLGLPIHADPSSGVWYPFVWVIGYFLGYNVYTIGLEFWFHVFIAGIGFYKLGTTLKLSPPTALIAAICYMLCGIFVGNSAHFAFVISACWLPFIINYYLRIGQEKTYLNSIKAACFLFLQITGGYPAFTMILFYLLLIFFIHHLIEIFIARDKKNIQRFFAQNALFFILTILLSAGSLLSVYEVMPYITRTSDFTITKALFDPFSPQSCISFILPFATTKNPEFFSTDFAMNNAYFGILMFLFFILGLFLKKPFQFKILLFFGIFSLAASFGSYLPVREFLYNYVPMMNIFRFPSTFRFFAIIGFIMTGAYWLDNFIQNDFDTNRKKIKTGLLIMLTILCLSVLIARLSGYLSIADFVKNDLFVFSKTSTIGQHIAFQAMFQIVIVGLFLILIWKVKDKGNFIKYTALIIVFELLFNAQLNEPYTSYSGEFSAKEACKHIEKFPSGFPQLPDIAIADANPNPVYFGPFWRNVGVFQKQIYPDAFNSFLFSGHEFLKDNTPKFFKSILKNKIVFLSDEIADETILETYKDSAFNRKMLFFKKEEFEQLKINNLKSAYGDTAQLVYFAPDSFVVNTSTKNDQLITLLQNNYRGWEVLINQKSVQVYTSNKSLISAVLPAGQNTVCFYYHNNGIKVAFWISLITLAASLVIIIVGNKKQA